MNILSHGPLIVAAGRLLRMTVPAKIRRYYVIVLREHWDLVTPAVPGFGKAVKKKHGRALAGFDIMHSDAVDLGRVVANVQGHQFLSSLCRRGRPSLGPDIQAAGRSSTLIHPASRVSKWRYASITSVSASCLVRMCSGLITPERTISISFAT